MKKNYLILLLFFSIYLSISFVSIHLLTDGVVGMRHDWISPYYSDQIEDHVDIEFQTWSDATSHSFLRRNLLYFKLFQGSIGLVTGFNPALFTLSTIVSLLVMSGFFMFFLSKIICSSVTGGFIAGLFYMINPVIFNKIIAGHTGFLFSYALAPLIILFFYLGTRKGFDWKYIIPAGITFGFAFAQHQFIIMIPLILLISLVVHFIISGKISGNEIKSFIVFLFIGFCMHLFWIVTNLFYSSLELSRIGPVKYHAFENAAVIWEGFIMIGWSQPYDYVNLIEEGTISTGITVLLYLIITISFFSLYSRKGLKNKIIYSSLFLSGVLLTTGVNAPGGTIFRFAYTTFPILRIFRDPYTFTFYIALSISILLAFFIKDIHNFIKMRTRKDKHILFIVVITLSSLLLFSGSPILTGDFSEQVQTYNFPVDYGEVYNLLSHEQTLSRILFFPSLQPILIDGNTFAGRDNMIHFPPKPSFPQNVDRMNRFNRFHMNTILNLRSEEDVSNFLRITSTEYIINRDNYESWYYKYVPGSEDIWKKMNFNDEFQHYSRDYDSSNLTVFRGDYSPFIRITKPYYGIGNLNLLKSIPKSVIDNISIVFLGDTPQKMVDEMNLTTITNQGLYTKESFLCLQNSTEIIRLRTEETNPNNGWSYDDNIWRLHPSIANDLFFNGYQTVMTSDENAILNNSIHVDINSYYRIFARIYQSRNGGKIKITIDDKSFSFDTRHEIEDFVFKDLGLFTLNKGNHELKLENLQGFNAVSFITITPLISYNKYVQSFDQEFLKNGIIYVFEAEEELSLTRAKNLDYTLKIDDEIVLDLESVGSAWKEIYIEKEDEYYLAIKASGEFDISFADRNVEYVNDTFGYSYFGPFNLSKGYYNLSFNTIGDSVVTEFLFEDLDQWGKPTRFFKAETTEDAYEGASSLKLSTKSEKSPTWSWMKSDEFNVTSGNKYRIVTHMKHRNVKQSHVPLEGYNDSTGQWQQITQLPSGKDGDSDWDEYDYILDTPQNISKIRFVLNAGWVLDNNTGEAITWFDDFKVFPINKGFLDKIWVYSSKEEKSISELLEIDNENHIIDFKKISPTEYQVKIDATSPFLLTFSEAYDSNWKVKMENGLEIDAIPVFDSINGFWINKNGKYEMSIIYEPQQMFDIGLYFSAFFVIGSLGFIIYKEKKRFKILIRRIK